MPSRDDSKRDPNQAIDEALKEGHYARKQIFLKNRLIAWSHRRRFQVGLSLANELHPRSVLDYGSGDGTFLAMLMQTATPPGHAVGAELEEKVIEDCRQRFSSLASLDFLRVLDLDACKHAGAFEAVFCMEVFEHVVEPEPELSRLRRLLAKDGRLCISVPVETGLSLAVKQVARRLAAWRGVGDYPGSEPYTWAEFWRSVFAGRGQHIRRPVHVDTGGLRSHDHKGFNWKVLAQTVGRYFTVESIRTSPLGWLPAWTSSQVWLVCRHRGDVAKRA